jgi:hypothetical protein
MGSRLTSGDKWPPWLVMKDSPASAKRRTAITAVAATDAASHACTQLPMALIPSGTLKSAPIIARAYLRVRVAVAIHGEITSWNEFNAWDSAITHLPSARKDLRDVHTQIPQTRRMLQANALLFVEERCA